MKVITVLVGDIYAFPPVLNLLNVFEKLGIESILITTRSRCDIRLDYSKTVVEEICIDYEKISSPIKKLIKMPGISKELWKKIDKYYDDESFLWVITDVTIKFLGNKLCNKRYILYLMELSQKIYLYHKIKFLKMDEKRIGNNAIAIIVPEYNRAQLTKAWWELKKLPYILPNKPFINEVYTRRTSIDDLIARDIISKIGEKKIILYQGIISPERPLDMFIEAVDEYNGKYAFVVMSSGKNIYAKCDSPNYYFIPFVTPPKHLQITSYAHIGVLSYVPTQGTGYSILNTLFCAPNKTFEYSMFGIPMIGNDIPGLKFLFGMESNGVCFNSFTKKDICDAINIIEKNYEGYSNNSYAYYQKCDYEKIVKNILEEIDKNGE